MGSGFRAVLGKFRMSGLGFKVGLGPLQGFGNTVGGQGLLVCEF